MQSDNWMKCQNVWLCSHSPDDGLNKSKNSKNEMQLISHLSGFGLFFHVIAMCFVHCTFDHHILKLSIEKKTTKNVNRFSSL